MPWLKDASVKNTACNSDMYIWAENNWVPIRTKFNKILANPSRNIKNFFPSKIPSKLSAIKKYYDNPYPDKKLIK